MSTIFSSKVFICHLAFVKVTTSDTLPSELPVLSLVGKKMFIIIFCKMCILHNSYNIIYEGVQQTSSISGVNAILIFRRET